MSTSLLPACVALPDAACTSVAASTRAPPPEGRPTAKNSAAATTASTATTLTTGNIGREREGADVGSTSYSTGLPAGGAGGSAGFGGNGVSVMPAGSRRVRGRSIPCAGRSAEQVAL